MGCCSGIRTGALEHKVSIGSTALFLGTIALAIASVALAIILKNNPNFLGPVNVLGNMTLYGVGGLYAGGLLLITAAIVLLCFKHKADHPEHARTLRVHPSQKKYRVKPADDPVNALNAQDNRPLGTAIWKRDVSQIERLLEGGADPSLADSEGRTLLIEAVWATETHKAEERQNSLKIIDLLLVHPSIDLNQLCGSSGASALHDACKQLDPDLVERLLKDKRTNVEVLNQARDTPMFSVAKAFLQGKIKTSSQLEAAGKIIRLLIKYGANLARTDKRGRTAAQIAGSKYGYLFTAS